MAERIFYQSPSSDVSQTRKAPNPKKDKKSKFNFKEKKNNTINSLNEVEAFLNDFKHFKRYVHLYKFFK